jgi:hypothetical protein
VRLTLWLNPAGFEPRPGGGRTQDLRECKRWVREGSSVISHRNAAQIRRGLTLEVAQFRRAEIFALPGHLTAFTSHPSGHHLKHPAIYKIGGANRIARSR